MYRHFRAVAEAVDLPMVLYNVPGRTVADMTNATVLRLAQVPGVIGLKDASGDIARGSALLAEAPSGFAVYGGNDDSVLALMAMGAHGVISVTANVAPGPMAQMCKLALAGDWPAALSINRRLLPLHLDLFVEANPIPVKWALAEMGRIRPGIRLPLTPLSAERHEVVRAALKRSGVIN
jgi:4-hydroxy-tetrahydrodipicolinate synthase